MIKDSNGERLENREEIEEELDHHFHDIMTKPILERSGGIEQITQHIPALVSQDQNYLLMNPIQRQEAEEVIKQMENSKASGPYGFTVNFFHHFWDMVKEEVWNIVEYLLSTQMSLLRLSADILYVGTQKDILGLKFSKTL